MTVYWEKLNNLTHIQEESEVFLLQLVVLTFFLRMRILKKNATTYKQSNNKPSINTFAASYLNTQGLNNSYLKSPASTLVDLTFQSRARRYFSLNQLRNLSL